MIGLFDSHKNKVGQCMTTKEIWNKVQSLYSNESLTTTIHADQGGKEDQHKTRKEATPKLSNEDQFHPKEELGKYPPTETHSSSSILARVNERCILSVMIHSSKE